ncbi:hypothetical protein FUAX_04520 [Fulvitalea axinellae]|uniref:STAS/SEC14 domain-containing protein n=1 Tax=Fulvitalea axinellae TaxID=1182444 RepID=A0AAU9DAZ8_9BACT|nr:hypothetical protein FUAX_04520 [Fulvitalea axinellae]
MTVAFENEFIIYGHQDDYAVFRYKAPTPNDEIRKAITSFVEYVKEQGLKMHLADSGNMGTVSVEVQEWVAKEVMPEMAKNAGGKYKMAGILSGDVFASFAFQNVARRTTVDGVSMCMFDNEPEAVAWLKEGFED